MKTPLILSLILVVSTLCSCGVLKDSGESSTIVNTDSLTARVDPLIIELQKFEGRELVGDRSYLSIVGGVLNAKIPTVIGMVASGVTNSANALIFDKCDAHISQPRWDKKGTRYSFDVTARGASFFGRSSNVSWRFFITVYNNGFVSLSIESDDLLRMTKAHNWRFDGVLNKERMDAATIYMNNFVK